jgi:PilZ domain
MDPESIGQPFVQAHSISEQGRRRRHTRHKLHVRAYVTFDQDHDGLIRDLSEYGLALQAVAVLRIHQHIRLRFELVNPRTRVDAVGQVVWTNRSGEAGIQFTQIGKRTQQLLKDWLLMNVLATASYVSSGSEIFHAAQASEHNTDLIFSQSRRPTIQLSEPLKTGLQRSVKQGGDEAPEPLLECSWWPVPIVSTTFSRIIDALILLVSALFFVLIFLAIAPQTPSRLESLGLGLGAAVPLSVVYWLMFVVYGSGTPGSCLVRIAAGNSIKRRTAERETDHAH